MVAAAVVASGVVTNNRHLKGDCGKRDKEREERREKKKRKENRIKIEEHALALSRVVRSMGYIPRAHAQSCV